MNSSTLTLEIVERFLEDNDAVELSHFTSIEDEAAEVLVSHYDGHLNLEGLLSVNQCTASVLASHRGGLSLLGSASEAVNAASPSIIFADESDFVDDDDDDSALMKALAGEDESEDSPLVKALAEGDIESSRSLIESLDIDEIANALCLTDGGVEEALGFLSSAVEEYEIFGLNSPQFLLCGKPQVVALSEVVEKCGPLYGPFSTFSFGPRPVGWGVAAKDNRVLSWNDGGFGQIGDQIVNINVRYIAARSLDAFEGALIAGPIESVHVNEWSEDQEVVTWKGCPLSMNPFNVEVFREICNEMIKVRDNLYWNYNFGEWSAVREAFCFYINHPEADQYADILLARVLIRSDDEEAQDLLERAVTLDPTVKSWADWIKAWIAFPDELPSMDCLEATDSLEAALYTTFQTFVALKNKQQTDLGTLQALDCFRRDPASPYLSTILAWAASMCVDVYIDNHEAEFESGDFEACSRAIHLGYRGRRALAWMIHASSVGGGDFVEQCLEAGLKPVGRFVGGGYLNMMATAVSAENLEATQAFLKYGASLNEPSHYGGRSCLELIEMEQVSEEFINALRLAGESAAE